MQSNNVTPQEILDAIQRVPVIRWGEVLTAIESMQVSPPSTEPTGEPVRTGKDLRDSALIGIWADRADLGNDHEFARELRRSAEWRAHQGSSDASGH